MKKEIKEELIIPEGIEIEVKDGTVTVKKGEDSLTRRFMHKFNIKKQDNLLILQHPTATKTEKKLIKTASAHIQNMINGLQVKYVYELRICFVHFPISVEKKGHQLIVKNFLGEKTPRRAALLPGVDVEVDKETIKIESYDKEKAGQTAANIESATRVRYRDRRVFQDGIFITKKSKGKR